MPLQTARPRVAILRAKGEAGCSDPQPAAAGCYVKAADWYPALRGFDRVGRRLSWEELTSG